MLVDRMLRRRYVVPVLAAFTVATVAPSWANSRPAGYPNGVSNNPPQLAQAAGRLTYAAAKTMLGKVYAILDRQRKAADATVYDPRARVTALGSKIETLYAFVRDKIAYQPYAGVMRLSQGTLMSGAGNACDQALLLSSFLGHYKHQVRYAFGTLDPAEAERLVATAGPSRAVAGPVDDAASDRRWAAALGEAGFKPAAIERLLARRAAGRKGGRDYVTQGLDRHGAEIAKALAAIGHDPAKAVAPGRSSRLAAARDHCWLQVRIDGKWRDLDPTLPKGRIGDRRTKAASTATRMPVSRAYRMRLTVTIEQSKGKKRAIKTVLDRGFPLVRSINHVELTFIPENSLSLKAIEKAKPSDFTAFKIVWPVIKVNGAVAAGEPFDMAGDVVAADPRVRQAKGIRKGTSKGFGGATRKLGGLFGGKKKAKPAPPVLARAMLRLEITGPGGVKRVVTRQLARRAKARPAKADKTKIGRDLREQLLARFQLIATASRISGAYVKADMIERVLKSRKMMETTLAIAYGKAKMAAAKPVIKNAGSERISLLRFFGARADLRDRILGKRYPNLFAFAAEPQIAIFRSRITSDAVGKRRVEMRFDIVANRLHILPRSGTPRNAGSRAIRMAIDNGVLDTLTEFLLMGDPAASNTAPIFAASRARGIASVTLKPGQPSAAKFLKGAPAAARAHLRADLAKGFAILAPASPVTLGGRSAYGWWRVDPRTGETLGIGANGEGTTMTERVILEAKGHTELVPYLMVLCLIFGGFIVKPNDSMGTQAAKMGACFAAAIFAGGVLGGMGVMASAGLLFEAVIGIGGFLAVMAAFLGLVASPVLAVDHYKKKQDKERRDKEKRRKEREKKRHYR